MQVINPAVLNGFVAVATIMSLLHGRDNMNRNSGTTVLKIMLVPLTGHSSVGRAFGVSGSNPDVPYMRL